MRPQSLAHAPKRLLALVAALAVTIAVAVAGLVLFQSGSGASSIGGTIGRTEINKRAQYWIDRHVMYSQTSYTWDVDHSKTYRQDCSGFVTMAWHAAGDHYTGNMLSISHKISYSQLQPGDAMLRLNEGHTALFEGWANSGHTSMYVWEESTYGKPALKTTWGSGYFDQFYAVRYDHVSGSGGTPPPPPPKNQGGSWPNVSQGAHGQRVVTVQLLLRAHGYSLGADGAFGPLTRSRVRSFQSAHHLSVDGVVGAHTWGALIVQVRQGSTGAAVTALQRQLNAHGYHLGVDGVFGRLTAAAVRSYQSRHHLSVDGVVGPQTWRSLVS
jgi:hypothetical protein